MGLLSHRRKWIEVQPEQKWDYISLGDFKSTSCLTPFAYAYLWFMLILSVAVYAVDIFIAYQLLRFNTWSGQIAPTQLIPFDISKWIFTICIILSLINLGFEHFRAFKIIKRGSVAESFLDSLAGRLQSIRLGKGRGYKRFLVFAELTKSKKGSEIVALFTFFSFQAWVRVIICSGPRQVINALTLYSVYIAKLSVEGTTFESSLGSFFAKLRALAESDYRQAVVLGGMLFTLVVWVFTFLCLLVAALCFVFYLWHVIPADDGGLTGFCERKVNKRLKQIVSEKIDKAMAADEQKRRRAEMKAAAKNGGDMPLRMQPSLPTIPSVAMGGNDKLPEMPMLSRTDTVLTMDTSGRPGTPGSFELNALGQKRPVPTRSATTITTASYSSRAPLLNGAAEIGMTPDSPAPSLPTPNGLGGIYGPPSRTGTVASNRSYGPASQINRMPSNGSSLREGYNASPAPYPPDGLPAMPVPIRSPTAPPGGYRGPGPNQPNWPNPGQGRATYDDYPGGRASPAPSHQSYGSNPLSPQGMGPNGYPVRSATGPLPPRGPPQRFPPQRNMTAPAPGFAQHQHTDSNGSLRNMASPARPYHASQGSMDFDLPNRPGTSNSQRPGPRLPYAQAQQNDGYDYYNRPPTAQSQRIGPGGAQQPYQAQGGSGDGDYFSRPPTAPGQRPGQQAYQAYQPGVSDDYPGRSPTSNGQRNPSRGGYGEGNNGWNQDVERGNGPRY